MSKHRKPQSPPRFLPARFRPAPVGAPGLLELDRFSEADINHWNELSKDLDELSAVLYSGIEPQRQRYHEELIEALGSVPAAPLDFTGWVRIVQWRYTNTPLAAHGSLTKWGGRFNIGVDVDNAISAPWPALYIASDLETAYREKFGIAKVDRVDGLSAEELALQPGDSYSAIRVNGHLDTVFDFMREGALDPLCNVLKKFKMPAEAERLRKRLKISRQQVFMIRTPERLMREVMQVNWRAPPSQFGNPAPSQILGGLILDAGYEAIHYRSTKGNGECVAVFPHRLVSDASFVALADPSPPEALHRRLDMTTADALCGWEILPPSLRPRRNPLLPL